MAKFDLKEYARRGAQARAAELNTELKQIYRAFPDLRSGTRGRRGTVNRSATNRKTTQRRTMSAAQKKAVSARMKKYWAERRKAKATK